MLTIRFAIIDVWDTGHIEFRNVNDIGPKNLSLRAYLNACGAFRLPFVIMVAKNHSLIHSFMIHTEDYKDDLWIDESIETVRKLIKPYL